MLFQFSVLVSVKVLDHKFFFHLLSSFSYVISVSMSVTIGIFQSQFQFLSNTVNRVNRKT